MVGVEDGEPDYVELGLSAANFLTVVAQYAEILADPDSEVPWDLVDWESASETLARMGAVVAFSRSKPFEEQLLLAFMEAVEEVDIDRISEIYDVVEAMSERAGYIHFGEKVYTDWKSLDHGIIAQRELGIDFADAAKELVTDQGREGILERAAVGMVRVLAVIDEVRDDFLADSDTKLRIKELAWVFDDTNLDGATVTGALRQDSNFQYTGSMEEVYTRKHMIEDLVAITPALRQTVKAQDDFADTVSKLIAADNPGIRYEISAAAYLLERDGGPDSELEIGATFPRIRFTGPDGEIIEERGGDLDVVLDGKAYDAKIKRRRHKPVTMMKSAAAVARRGDITSLYAISPETNLTYEMNEVLDDLNTVYSFDVLYRRVPLSGRE